MKRYIRGNSGRGVSVYQLPDAAGVGVAAGDEEESSAVGFSREAAENLACAILQACGWDTAALLAPGGGKAPVYVGEPVSGVVDSRTFASGRKR